MIPSQLMIPSIRRISADYHRSPEAIGSVLSADDYKFRESETPDISQDQPHRIEQYRFLMQI